MSKRNITISVDEEIVKKARELGVSLSEACEQGLVQAVREVPDDWVAQIPKEELPYIVQAVRSSPAYAHGQSRKLKNKFNIIVSPQEIISWANKHMDMPEPKPRKLGKSKG